jgi:aspartate/glutamate racemase
VKTIGLLGGMSWESSAEYYRLVNEQVKAWLGGLHSARCVLYSVDFAEIEQLQQQGDWDTAGELLAQAAHQLELAGAELLVVCTNTMHRVATSRARLPQTAVISGRPSYSSTRNSVRRQQHTRALRAILRALSHTSAQ